jgi:hypothetical protein
MVNPHVNQNFFISLLTNKCKTCAYRCSIVDPRIGTTVTLLIPSWEKLPSPSVVKASEAEKFQSVSYPVRH